MTHQNHQTNGASLEDCHTNFFALTELYGIKWRKLVWGETSGGGGVGEAGEEGAAALADPVISSYARCLAGDILCVWRRVPAPQPNDNIYEIAPPIPPPLSLRAAKELWIFWYGEEPDLNGLVAPELIASQGDQGSWESGLSYECRSLLFKALHNLIERCLLSRDFVRLGKWFVQPYDGDEEEVGNSPWHLSFSFAFFLHGESTVCASVDVRQHPPVRTLTAKRRAKLAAPANQDDAKVILAPFGLEGRLTGRWWGEGEGTQRLLDAWRLLYPLEHAASAVEVVCGGVRMRYPSPYVLVAGDTLPAPSTPPNALAQRAASALTTPMPHQPPELCFSEWTSEKGEDFVDPTRKTNCSCAKSRRRRRHARQPFHCRSAPGGGVCSPGSCGGGSPGAGASAPPSAGAPPPSPHHTTIPQPQSVCPPTTLHTPAPTPEPPTPRSARAAPPPPAWRRPALPAPPPPADPDGDTHHLHMLYDYSTVHAWLEHPVKRFKTAEPSFVDSGVGKVSNSDLYAGHDHTLHAEPMAPSLQIKQEKFEPEDTKEYKNLFTSDGLCPTLKDLDQIFDNSDDAASGDETVRLMNSTTACPLEERWAGRTVRAEELSKMFPTPPSLEAHAQCSPGGGFTFDDLPPRPPSATPPIDPIEDWSYVFKPPLVCKYVGSSKYAPLPALPSQLMPRVTLPPHAVYTPRADNRHTGSTRASPPLAAPPRSPPPAAPPATRAPPPVPAATRAPCAACPLLLNVLLADTVLNVFRDHNFDSCTLCVCNASPRVVGNIRGADAATYLFTAEGGAPGADDEPAHCTCGFSAVVNRRRAYRAGLFYEDEVEITGSCYSSPAPSSGRAGSVSGVLLAACAAPAAPPDALARAARDARRRQRTDSRHDINQAEFMDGSAAAARALSAAASGAAGAGGEAPACHRWPFIGARAPTSSRDVVRLMRRLRPLLQDAIQKRCCGARMWDGVSGPLTWRQFHRLAGRGNEDLCEPQPVPPLLVGYDRDWISLSPYALRHWERLSLEPYSYAKDVAFVVIAPDSDALTDPVRTFFRELSDSYEACKLGRHRPVCRVARDGVVRASADARLAPDDDWTPSLPPRAAAARHVRAYADTLRAVLLPALSALTLDGAVFEPEPPAAPEPGTEDPEATPGATGPASQSSTGTCSTPPEEEAGAPSLVIYVVEPPGGDDTLHDLLKLASRVTNHLHHHNPLVKIISLESIWSLWGISRGAGAMGGAASELRQLAFSVFSGTRRLLTHRVGGKSLTGFGTAANASIFLNKLEKNRQPYRMFNPAWVLAPGRALKEVAESWGQPGSAETCGVLYVAYCLSHDQRWLLAACSDARGEHADCLMIDVHVPDRARRRRMAPARRLGLTKLMDFIIGVISQAAQPWRLVVGRVGRIGHGELKGWSWLLSRKNLVRLSGVLRETCSSCSALWPGGAPSLQSACLVSTEPDSCLRLMADRFTPDERFSQASIQSHLHTPRDVTATHILVFPTSATTQSNQMPMASGEDGDIMFLGVDMGDEDMGDMSEDNMTDLFIGDMSIWGPTSPQPAPHAPRPEPTAQEQVGTVLQQPLALGYLVSTAPARDLPRWWWAACPQLQAQCPAFLNNALHLHSGNVHHHDDFFTLTNHKPSDSHPLDSQTTTDVLRYVLEGYNALSWLTLDAKTHDRLSCLPLHFQLLMQLYHTTAALD